MLECIIGTRFKCSDPGGLKGADLRVEEVPNWQELVPNQRVPGKGAWGFGQELLPGSCFDFLSHVGTTEEHFRGAGAIAEPLRGHLCRG